MLSHKGAASLTSLPGLPRVSANLERPPGLQRSQEARPRKTHAPASDLWWVLDPLCEVPQSQSCPREGDEELGLGSPSGGRWPPARVASLVPKVLTGPGGRLSTWFTHLESKTVKPVTQEQWPPPGDIGYVWRRQGGVLPASGGWRPEMLLAVPRGTGRPTMLVVPVGSPALRTPWSL